METLAWLGDFHPKKLVREGANWHEGTRGWVNKGAVTKKKMDLGRNIFLDGVFASHLIWSSTKLFHVGLKKVFCERGGWVRVGENCI